jgi:hypothetical protein
MEGVSSSCLADFFVGQVPKKEGGRRIKARVTMVEDDERQLMPVGRQARKAAQPWLSP